MIRLRSILLLVCVINVSSQESTTTSVQDNPSLIHNSLSYNIRDELGELKNLIVQLNTRFAQQDTRFAQLDAKCDCTKIADPDNKIAEQNAKIKDLEMKIERLENGDVRKTQAPSQSHLTTKEASSIFTRWGRRDCPETVSQLVYSGIAGGSHYTHSGGAAEYVCLPPDPIWDTNKYYNEWTGAFMFGTEYEHIPQPVKDLTAPCAVCRTTQYSTVLMIPARTQCYPGWQEAYHGELVTNYYNYAGASQYVCLDGNPQTNGTRRNEDGKLMFPVRAKCGSLPCPPYEDNTLLTCVVCLK